MNGPHWPRVAHSQPEEPEAPLIPESCEGCTARELIELIELEEEAVDEAELALETSVMAFFAAIRSRINLLKRGNGEDTPRPDTDIGPDDEDRSVA